MLKKPTLFQHFRRVLMGEVYLKWQLFSKVTTIYSFFNTILILDTLQILVKRKIAFIIAEVVNG